jgi:hypothetical protein
MVFPLLVAERDGSRLLSFEFQDAADDAGDAFPLFGFERELFRAFLGDRVELCFAVVVGGAPFSGDPALLLETEQGSVDGALVQFQNVLAHLLDTAGDAEAVLRSEGVESFEDHEVESALEDVGFSGHVRVSLWTFQRRYSFAPLDCPYERRRRLRKVPFEFEIRGVYPGLFCEECVSG